MQLKSQERGRFMKTKTLIILCGIILILQSGWVFGQEPALLEYNIGYGLDDQGKLVRFSSILNFLNSVSDGKTRGKLIYDSRSDLSVVNSFSKYLSVEAYPESQMSSLDLNGDDFTLHVAFADSQFLPEQLKNLANNEADFEGIVLLEKDTENYRDNFYLVAKDALSLEMLLAAMRSYETEPAFKETLVLFDCETAKFEPLGPATCDPNLETDGGDKPFVAGSLNPQQPGMCDECNQERLTEYICRNNRVFLKRYDCANGCKNNACKAEDSQPLQVAISSPLDASFISNLNLVVQGTVSDDDNVAKVRINLNNEVVQEVAVINGQFSHTFTGLSDGPKTITVTCQNDAGKTASASVNFTVDTIPPAVIITSPLNNSYTNQTSVTLTGTVDGVAFSESRTLAQEGENTLTKEATDQAGNRGSASVQVIRDTIAPRAIIAWPSNGALFMKTPISVRYTVDGVSHDTVQNLTEGSNTITRSATDLAGNTGTASIQVIFDTTPPEIIHNRIPGAVRYKPVNFDARVADIGSGVDRVEVIVSWEGRTPVMLPVTKGGTFQGYEFYQATFTPRILGSFTYIIKAWDKLGKSTQKGPYTVTVRSF